MDKMVLGLVNPGTVGSIISGNSMEWVEGIVGFGYNKGLRFGGSPQHVSINSVFGLTNTGLSIALWVNTPQIGSGAFIKIGSGGATGIALGMGTGNFDNAGSRLIGLFEGVRWIDTQAALGSGWHHVAMVINNGGSPTFYLDGNNVGTFNGSNALSPTTHTFIGGYVAEGIYSRFYSGVVDDLRIYNKPLSATEIGSLFSKKNYPLGNIVAYYKFDEGIGSFVYNSASVEMPSADSILHYRLNVSGESIIDETAKIIGSAINASNGVFWVDGVYGNGSAIRFSGGNPPIPRYFELFNTHPEFNFNSGTPFSLSIWANLVGGNFSGTLEGLRNSIWGKGRYDPNYGINIESGTLANYSFIIRSGNSVIIATAPPLPRNQWNHIVGVYNGSNQIQIFFNGSPGSVNNTAGLGFDVSVGSLELGITQNIGGGNPTFNFVIDLDEPRIYNRALTLNEIKELYEGKTIQPLLGDRKGKPFMLDSDKLDLQAFKGFTVVNRGGYSY